jgi:hypothetical protein
LASAQVEFLPVEVPMELFQFPHDCYQFSPGDAVVSLLFVHFLILVGYCPLLSPHTLRELESRCYLHLCQRLIFLLATDKQAFVLYRGLPLMKSWLLREFDQRVRNASEVGEYFL